MIKYYLAFILLTTFSLNAQTATDSNVKSKSVQSKIKIEKVKPKKQKNIEVVQEIEKSTLDVEVIKYAIPNNSEVSFPVTVRKNSLEEDN